jgi:L-amino acid N-acyltransferase YncA
MSIQNFIREMTTTDWPDVQRIYLEGIATGNATFETEAPSWEHWDQNHHRFGRLVIVATNEVAGWAALGAVSSRRVYSGVAEVSVYVASSARGQGFGSALLGQLIELSEKNGIWTLQAGIFPENTASIELHRRFGFREVGRRERIGKLNGVWRDTLLLQRRSAVVGLD